MAEKFVVRLSPEERQQLEELAGKGKTGVYRIRHANILLKTDADGPRWTGQRIAKAFGCHVNTVVNVRKRCVIKDSNRRLSVKNATRSRFLTERPKRD